MEEIAGVRTMADLSQRVHTNPQLRAMMVEKPEEVIAAAEVEISRHLPDTKVYHIALWSLALTVVLAVVGGVLLVYQGKEAPDWLSALGATAIGAIAGLIQSR